MHKFDYLKPADIADAARLASADDEAKFLSGGMTLLPTMKQRLAAPSALIDLTKISALKGIEIKPDGKLRVGGATVHADVASSQLVQEFCPAIAFLAGNIGDPAVRHRGTIGGSVANNDPAADYPSAVLALNATICTSQREFAADDFFLGLFETGLDDGEFITAFEFSAPQKAGYGKFPNPASRYAMAGVFVAKLADGAVRVVVTGAGSEGVFRWSEAEEALATDWSVAAIEPLTMSPDNLMSDIHAQADYRAALVKAMAKNALGSAH